jgi:hypothetical protein
MREAAYDSEDVLQGLLARYPNLLAGEQIDASKPRRWLLVAREVGLASREDSGNRWSVDHLFLDQDGIPTIVEVKRSSDTRIRREVVGQMLDYAANAILFWPVESLKALFETQCEKAQIESDIIISEFLGTDNEIEVFWDNVKTNLKAGKVRLVFVADEIPSELRRIIEFLNIQMDPADIIGIEVKQYAGKNLKTLVPRVVTKTSVKDDSISSVIWNEDLFFSTLESKNGKNIASIAKSIFTWTQSKPVSLRIWWGKGKQDGSFYPLLDYKGEPYWLFSLWTYGRVAFQFGMMSNKPPFDDDKKRLELLNRLNAIPQLNIPEDSINRYPSILISALNNPDKLKQFTDTFSWYIEEIKNYVDNKEKLHSAVEKKATGNKET